MIVQPKDSMFYRAFGKMYIFGQGSSFKSIFIPEESVVCTVHRFVDKAYMLNVRGIRCTYFAYIMHNLQSRM